MSIRGLQAAWRPAGRRQRRSSDQPGPIDGPPRPGVWLAVATVTADCRHAGGRPAPARGAGVVERPVVLADQLGRGRPAVGTAGVGRAGRVAAERVVELRLRHGRGRAASMAVEAAAGQPSPVRPRGAGGRVRRRVGPTLARAPAVLLLRHLCRPESSELPGGPSGREALSSVSRRRRAGEIFRPWQGCNSRTPPAGRSCGCGSCRRIQRARRESDSGRRSCRPQSTAGRSLRGWRRKSPG